MDQADCQLEHAPAPRAAYANRPVIARAAPVDLQETSDAETRRWNGAMRLCLRLYAAICVRQLSVHYQTPLPSGPAIIALNHANVTDVFLLPAVFPGDICFLAQANLFDIPIVGDVLKRAGQLPVVRGQPAALLEAAACRLQQGYSIAVCPEGRLNHGGPLHRAGVGTVRLAMQSGFPIVPVGFYVADRDAKVIRATVDGRATHGRWQVGGACHVSVGRPWWPRLWPPQMAEGEGSYRPLRRLTDQLMQEIAALVRQAETSAAQ
jgi:1-acyl-sn-glycerol-3-phosphate acyltransferase